MGMIRNAAWAAMATIAGMTLPATAWAVTECPGTVARIYAGDHGAVYIFLKTPAGGDGVIGILASGDSNREAILSMAMTAQAAHRSVSLRFTASDVSCSTWAFRSDFEGMFLEP